MRAARAAVPATRASPSVSSFVGLLQRKCLACGSPRIGKEQCQGCAKEDQSQLRRSAVAARTEEAGEAPELVLDVLRSPGHPLGQGARDFFEPRFKQDFSGVRVHSDSRAGASAMAVDAAAYTVGDNIVFGAGRFDPAGHAGRRLLAHELAHVVQQRASPGIRRPLATSLTIGSDQDPLERDADAQAQTVMQDASVSPRGARAPAAGVIQREPLEQTFSQDEAAVKPRCGPDITKWFVDRANEKMTDPGVLLVQSHLAIVEALAPMFLVTAGILASAGTTVVVLIKEAMLGERAPARDDNAKEQIGQGMWNLMLGAGPAALSAPLLVVSPAHRAAAIQLATSLIVAAVKWGTLVTHESEYDFKKGVLSFPKTGFCPDPKCDAGDYGVVTICPDPSGLNCYDTDAPGNIFYSLVGKYAGWNELTIKLGSQLAELIDDERAQIGWDTADDVKALALGHSWALPLDQDRFCSGVRDAKSELAYEDGCRDCLLGFDGQASGGPAGTGGVPGAGGGTKR